MLASALGLAALARTNILGLEAIKTNTVTIDGYEIGHVVEVYNGSDANYVMFEYTGLNGKKLEMAV